jgi:hypothetical protein
VDSGETVSKDLAIYPDLDSALDNTRQALPLLLPGKKKPGGGRRQELAGDSDSPRIIRRGRFGPARETSLGVGYNPDIGTFAAAASLGYLHQFNNWLSLGGFLGLGGIWDPQPNLLGTFGLKLVVGNKVDGLALAINFGLPTSVGLYFRGAFLNFGIHPGYDQPLTWNEVGASEYRGPFWAGRPQRLEPARYRRKDLDGIWLLAPDQRLASGIRQTSLGTFVESAAEGARPIEVLQSEGDFYAVSVPVGEDSAPRLFFGPSAGDYAGGRGLFSVAVQLDANRGVLQITAFTRYGGSIYHRPLTEYVDLALDGVVMRLPIRTSRRVVPEIPCDVIQIECEIAGSLIEKIRFAEDCWVRVYTSPSRLYKMAFALPLEYRRRLGEGNIP